MAERYEEVAQRLAKAGVAVEASSAGLRVAAEEMYPHPDLLSACGRAGVPATIGSDSHKPEHVGYAFPQLVGALRDAGYTEYVRFKGRERGFYPLPPDEK
jgi:histidinol-phosphatase (PHP family)